MGVAGRRRLVARPGGLTHLVGSSVSSPFSSSLPFLTFIFLSHFLHPDALLETSYFQSCILDNNKIKVVNFSKVIIQFFLTWFIVCLCKISDESLC